VAGDGGNHCPVRRRLADRYPAGILCGIGLVVLSLGFILLALLLEPPSDADIIWRMAVCGCGFGFFQSPNNHAIQGTSRLLGQTIGAAVVALLFSYSLPAGGTSPSIAISLAAAFSILAAIASVCRLLNVVRLHRPLHTPDSLGMRAPRGGTAVRPPP
jgi:MFS transporter, DHA2 family, multidrug resistance protein